MGRRKRHGREKDVRPCLLLAMPVELLEDSLLVRCRRRDIIPLSATCKALRLLLLPKIFSHIHLHIPSHLAPEERRTAGDLIPITRSNIMDTCGAISSSSASSYLRELSISGWDASDGVGLPRNIDDEAQLLQLRALNELLLWTGKLPELRGLRFHAINLTEWHLSALFSLHRLESLALHDCNISADISSVSVGALRLVSFRMESCTVEPGVNSLFGAFICPDIREIRLRGLNHSPFPFLTAASPYMKLEVVEIDYPTLLERWFFIAALAPNAREVNVWEWNPDAHVYFPLPPTAMSSLTRLSVTTFHDFGPIMELPSLQHLCLEFRVQREMELLLRTLSDAPRGSCGAHSLQSITMSFDFRDLALLLRILEQLSLRFKVVRKLELAEHIELDDRSPMRVRQAAKDSVQRLLQALKHPVVLWRLRNLAISVGANTSIQLSLHSLKDHWMALLRRMSQNSDVEHVVLHIRPRRPEAIEFVYDRDIYGSDLGASMDDQPSKSSGWRAGSARAKDSLSQTAATPPPPSPLLFPTSYTPSVSGEGCVRKNLQSHLGQIRQSRPSRTVRFIDAPGIEDTYSRWLPLVD